MGKKPHVDFHRKVALRRRLISRVTGRNYYIPFIGDGDLACELYTDAKIFGADIDAKRVETAKARLPSARVIVADCNHFPFDDACVFHLADFNAYSEPYPAFRSFWAKANKADRIVLFFTDGHRQGIIRSGWVHYPHGEREHLDKLNDRRRLYNFYFPQVVLPWFTKYVKPYEIVQKAFYLRDMMLYWGAIIARQGEEEKGDGV